MNKLQQIYSAAIQVFGERKYVFILLLFALFFFALFVFIPVATTPGNTLAFQLSIFRPQDYFLMILLALLVGLNFSMNIYAWRKSPPKADPPRAEKQSVNISQSAASGAAAGLRLAGVASATQAGFGGAFAAIVGTATCASCLAFLFGIVGLGIGSVAFVLKYQTFFLLGAITLVLLSLYFTARKACPVSSRRGGTGTGVNRHCASCE